MLPDEALGLQEGRQQRVLLVYQPRLAKRHGAAQEGGLAEPVVGRRCLPPPKVVGLTARRLLQEFMLAASPKMCPAPGLRPAALSARGQCDTRRRGRPLCVLSRQHSEM